MRLYFTDLMCFQKNPANIPCKQAFNLDRLPTLSLKNDFAAYIFDRGCTLSYSSLRSECVQFHTLSDFLSEEYPHLTSLTDVPLDALQGSLKRWLLKKGLALSYKTSHPDRKNRPTVTIRYFTSLQMPTGILKEMTELFFPKIMTSGSLKASLSR